MAFGVDYTDEGFNPDDIPGMTASNILCKNGAEYPEGSGNFPTNMALPRLPENSVYTAQPKSRRRRA